MLKASEVLMATKQRWHLSADLNGDGSVGLADLVELFSYVFHAPIDAFISVANLSYVALPSFHRSLGLPLMEYSGWGCSLLALFFWAGVYFLAVAPFRDRHPSSRLIERSSKGRRSARQRKMAMRAMAASRPDASDPTQDKVDVPHHQGFRPISPVIGGNRVGNVAGGLQRSVVSEPRQQQPSRQGLSRYLQ